MYEVGPWFLHLMNLAILAIVGVVIMVAILVKKQQYQREAARCIQAELKTATGWSEYHTVRCGIDDKFVKVAGGDYKLDPNHREWARHPRLPFMGLASLQEPIRKGTWYKDHPNVPAYPGEEFSGLTSAEIEAKTREAAAIAVGAEIVETEARNRELVNAILNQPNKMVVYVMLGIADIGLAILAVNMLL